MNAYWLKPWPVFFAGSMLVLLVWSYFFYFDGLGPNEMGTDGKFDYRGKTELLYFWASVLLAGLAVFSFFFASRQLGLSQNQHWTDILLKMDERYRATDFVYARQSR